MLSASLLFDVFFLLYRPKDIKCFTGGWLGVDAYTDSFKALCQPRKTKSAFQRGGRSGSLFSEGLSCHHRAELKTKNATWSTEVARYLI